MPACRRIFGDAVVTRRKNLFQRLVYTYAAIAAGLGFSLLTRSVHWNTLNFWMTTAAAYTIVTVFDLLILNTLKNLQLTPTQFLFRMMIVVVTMQALFASIYYWGADPRSYLARGGQPISDFVDALYFSGVTLMTVGYGDIVPAGDFRFTAVAEVYGGTLFIFAFFAWGLGVLSDRK